MLRLANVQGLVVRSPASIGYEEGYFDRTTSHTCMKFPLGRSSRDIGIESRYYMASIFNFVKINGFTKAFVAGNRYETCNRKLTLFTHYFSYYLATVKHKML